jgi:hypothetical protein
MSPSFVFVRLGCSGLPVKRQVNQRRQLTGMIGLRGCGIGGKSLILKKFY